MGFLCLCTCLLFLARDFALLFNTNWGSVSPIYPFLGQWSMAGVIFPTVFTLYYFLFFNCLLVDICLLFLFPCFSDSFLSSQESTPTCLFFFISWAKNVGKRPAVSFFFSSRHIWKHVLLTFYVLLVLLIFNFFSRLLF